MKTFEDMINENSDGNYMVISNINQLLRAAQYLSEKIKLGDDVEGWVVDKLAKATNDIHIIHEFYKNLGHTIKTFKEVVNPGNYDDIKTVEPPTTPQLSLPRPFTKNEPQL